MERETPQLTAPRRSKNRAKKIAVLHKPTAYVYVCGEEDRDTAEMYAAARDGATIVEFTRLSQLPTWAIIVATEAAGKGDGTWDAVAQTLGFAGELTVLERAVRSAYAGANNAIAAYNSKLVKENRLREVRNQPALPEIALRGVPVLTLAGKIDVSDLDAIFAPETPETLDAAEEAVA